MDANSVALTSDNRTGNLYVTFTDPAALFALKESEGLDNYVIPLELVSDGNVNSEHNSILILPDVLEQVLLSFDQADTQFFVDGRGVARRAETHRFGGTAAQGRCCGPAGYVAGCDRLV